MDIQNVAFDHTTSSPRLAYGRRGEVFLFEDFEDGLWVGTLKGDHALWLEGSFAQMVRRGSWRDLRLDPRWRWAVRLHPWLAGLVDAVDAPPSLKELVMGDELGMLFIEITHRCNERCLHCYASASPEEGAILSLQEVEGVLLDARALGCRSVQFTGGDPLLHPDLIAMVALAHQSGMKEIEIYTNGLLLTSDLLDRLAPYAPRLAFSLYSHRPETHDRITQVPGSQQRTVKAIALATSRGFKVRAGGVVMEQNVGDEEGVTELLLAHGVAREAIGFDTVKGAGRGRFDPDTENRWHGGASTANEEAPSSLQAGLNECYTDAPQQASDAAVSDPSRRGKLCVSADATVYPCIFSRHARLGSIREGGLAGVVAALQRSPVAPPDPKRWDRCREGLTCHDCQWIAYALTGIDA